MRITILALDGLFDTGLTVMLDAFTLANNFSGGATRFDLSIAGMRRRLQQFGGTLEIQSNDQGSLVIAKTPIRQIAQMKTHETYRQSPLVQT